MRDHIIWRAVGDNLWFLRRRIVREGVGLALAGTRCNELSRVKVGDLPLHNAAIVSDRGECFGHVGAVDGEGGIFQRVSFGELYGDILAPAKIDELGGFSVDDRSGWGFFTAARVGVVAGAFATARSGARVIIATARIVSTRGVGAAARIVVIAAGRTAVTAVTAGVLVIVVAVARNRSTFARCNACVACGDAAGAFTGGDFGVLYVDMDVVRVGLDFVYFTCAVDGDVIGADGDGFYAGAFFNSDGGRFCDGEAVELAAA